MRSVESPSLRRDALAAAPWILVALIIWTIGVVSARIGKVNTDSSAPAWQHSYLELSRIEQRFYVFVREGILEAENVRSETGQWPAPDVLARAEIPPFDDANFTWERRQHGIYVNYVGIPHGSDSQRWLLLFIEPEKAIVESAPPPMDEEHHTLFDGTSLHVTVWSQPNEGPVPTDVLAFPVSDGWVQRVGR